MPHKFHHSKNNDNDIHEKLVHIYRNTSQAERFSIAEHWCQDFTIDNRYDHIAPPIYMIFAALIDVEHPLILADGRGLMYSYTACLVKILKTKLNRTPQPIPTQLVHTPLWITCPLNSPYIQTLSTLYTAPTNTTN